MTIDNTNTIVGPSHRLPTISNTKAGFEPNSAFDSLIMKGVGNQYYHNGYIKDETPKHNSNGSINIDSGSGDDEVIINGPVDGPVNIDSGSGDDKVIIGPAPVSPQPLPAAPVAANETGRIEGDPHFYGGDGGEYDVQGKPNTHYSMLADKGLDVRARFDAWGTNGATVMGETGVTVGEGMNSDYVNFRKDGTASINGQIMQEGKLYQLADGGTAKLENGELTVTTAEGYTIKQTTQDGAHGRYINMTVSTAENGVDNGRMPTGLLGQTFDADNAARNGAKGHGAQGEGAIVGDVSDYERSALDPINDNRGVEPAKENSWQEELQKFIQNLLENFDAFINKPNDVLPQPIEPSNMESDIVLGSDKDGNTIRVADDVENIRFENPMTAIV